MRKVLVGIILATLIVAPVLVAAQDDRVQEIDIIDALEDLVDWLFTILLIVAAIFLVIAAFTFITASGEPDKIAKARNFVLYALIGVAVAVASRGLIALVKEVMGG